MSCCIAEYCINLTACHRMLPGGLVWDRALVRLLMQLHVYCLCLVTDRRKENTTPFDTAYPFPSMRNIGQPCR